MRWASLSTKRMRLTHFIVAGRLSTSSQYSIYFIMPSGIGKTLKWRILVQSLRFLIYWWNVFSIIYAFNVTIIFFSDLLSRDCTSIRVCWCITVFLMDDVASNKYDTYKNKLTTQRIIKFIVRYQHHWFVPPAADARNEENVKRKTNEN